MKTIIPILAIPLFLAACGHRAPPPSNDAYLAPSTRETALAGIREAAERERQTLRDATPGATEPERTDCYARSIAATGNPYRQNHIEVACLQAAIAHHAR